MRISGYLLLAVAAACLATVQSVPTALPVQTTEPPQQEQEQAAASTQQGLLPSAGWGLASLDALAQRINDWVAPVIRVIEEVVRNKTVEEVVVDAKNATVVLATRVSQSDAVQGAKEAISPLTRLFDRVHERVKDKTLQQLAGDVQRQIERLDESVAEFIRGLSGDEEDQEIVEQIVPDVEEAPQTDPEQELAVVAAALDQAVEAENEVEP